MGSFLHKGLGYTPGLFDQALVPDPVGTILNGVVAWWEFTEGSSQDKNSEVSPNRPLQRINNPNRSTASLLGDFSVGAFNPDKALFLSKSSGVLSALEFPGNVFSFSCWVRGNDQDFGILFGLYDQGNNNRVYMLQKQSAGGGQNAVFVVSEDGSFDNNNLVSSGDSIFLFQEDEWVLIEGFFDNGLLGIATNSKAFVTQNTTAQVLYQGANQGANDTPFMVGARPDGGSITGTVDANIDQLIFWNRRLTPAERILLWYGGQGRTYLQIVGGSS